MSPPHCQLGPAVSASSMPTIPCNSSEHESRVEDITLPIITTEHRPDAKKDGGGWNQDFASAGTLDTREDDADAFPARQTLVPRPISPSLSVLSAQACGALT